MKYLLWTIIFIGIALFTRMLTHHNARHRSDQIKNKSAAQNNVPNNNDPEPMVRCANCGIHLPRSEAVLSGGQTWCSTEHAKIGARN